MPLIKLTCVDGERLVNADRVMRDSRVYVIEARRDGAWHRLVTVPAETVRSVERLVPGADGAQWLAEDVRTAAGLAGELPPPAPPAGRLSAMLRSSRAARSTRSGPASG